MEVRLYNNKSDPSRLDKVLTPIATHFATPYGDLTLEDPVFELSADTIANLKSVNYAYVPELNRYYYASVQLSNNGLYYLECHVDALYTYRGQIRKQIVIIDQAEDETLVNKDIDNGMYVSEANNIMSWKTFNVSFNTPYNILICAGGE